jgi:hypothetical protein
LSKEAKDLRIEKKPLRESTHFRGSKQRTPGTLLFPSNMQIYTGNLPAQEGIIKLLPAIPSSSIQQLEM